MFTHPKTFTFIGFYLLSLIDKGENLKIEDMKGMLSSKTLLRSLESKYALDFDMSLFSQEDIVSIETFFESCYETINEEKKFGVSKNGLCFLLAYCLEAAQRQEKDVVFS